MNRVPESRMMIARTLLGRLDLIEQRLFESVDYLAAEKVDEITINLSQSNDLEREYIRWVDRLADFFGAVKNPYSDRWTGAGKQPLNVRVSHC